MDNDLVNVVEFNVAVYNIDMYDNISRGIRSNGQTPSETG
jgi:hypothetical protein